MLFRSDVAASYNSTCAVDDAGELTCWGDWEGAGLPAGPFERVTMSDSIGCAWDSASAIRCWDSDGSYDVTRSLSDPIEHGTCTDSLCYFLTDAGEVEALSLDETTTRDAPDPYTSVETGSGGFYCFLETDGELTCRNGSRGADSPPDGPFLNVGLGALHACGQKTDGTFSCWGDSQSGQ